MSCGSFDCARRLASLRMTLASNRARDLRKAVLSREKSAGRRVGEDVQQLAGLQACLQVLPEGEIEQVRMVLQKGVIEAARQAHEPSELLRENVSVADVEPGLVG